MARRDPSVGYMHTGPTDPRSSNTAYPPQGVGTAGMEQSPPRAVLDFESKGMASPSHPPHSKTFLALEGGDAQP